MGKSVNHAKKTKKNKKNWLLQKLFCSAPFFLEANLFKAHVEVSSGQSPASHFRKHHGGLTEFSII